MLLPLGTRSENQMPKSSQIILIQSTRERGREGEGVREHPSLSKCLALGRI